MPNLYSLILSLLALLIHQKLLKINIVLDFDSNQKTNSKKFDIK